jgi:predicted transcriptional regulator
VSVVKEEAKKLIDALPEQATWDDLMYELYAKQKLQKALDEAAAGKVVSHQTAKKELTSR